MDRTVSPICRRALSQPDLLSRLDDFLYDLRQAGDYLGDWSADERGWLRRYYPPNSDEPHYDLTPATEKALDFVATLFESRPASTESRLLTVFELLRQLTEGTETNAETRIAELERRRSAIDADIRRLREGESPAVGRPPSEGDVSSLFAALRVERAADGRSESRRRHPRCGLSWPCSRTWLD
jgi:hypothetical protein